jgi:hypothetical protein
MEEIGDHVREDDNNDDPWEKEGRTPLANNAYNSEMKAEKRRDHEYNTFPCEYDTIQYQQMIC